MIDQFDIFGLRVSNFDLSDIEKFFSFQIEQNRSIVVFGYSLGYIPLIKKHPELYPIVNSFDLMVCDGTQFNWYCFLNGFKLDTVCSIPDITNFALEYADKNRLKVLFFGAKEEINKKASDNIQKKYPNLQMLDGINGYYSESQELEIVSKIKNEKPHVLLIGISTPTKEIFVNKFKSELNVNIIIPCGGMIDVYSGFTKQSPFWIKKFGLATPFRVLQEPKRLFLLNVWLVYEILFKIIPITILNRFILRKKNFNIIESYLNKKNILK